MAATEAICPLPEENPDQIRSWDMRARRTQAMPRNSLFGTNMENVDKDSLPAEGKYIPEGCIKPNPNRYPLPENLQCALTGKLVYESTRQEAEEQKKIISEINEGINAKAHGAYSFRPPYEKPVQSAPSRTSTRPSWLTNEDIKHSEDINIVGLNARGSYNRDKYGRKPRRHNYSLIGDIMAKNMDFNSPCNGEILNHKDAFRRGRANVFGPGQQTSQDFTDGLAKKNRKSKSLIDLPPNIRAIFGTNVCDNLLSNKDQVDSALERQKSRSGPPRPSKERHVESLPINFNANHERLGQAIRYNVFPGLTTEHTISRTQNDFNDEVHLRRVPNPDEYRYQRDHLSTWAEHNVLRDRMKKAWNEAYPLGGKKQ